MSDVSMLKVKMDALGRVTLPVKLRRMLGMEVLDYVYMTTDGASIKIFKRDKKELQAHINYIAEVASDSEDISISEYRVLCDIMNKLNLEEVE